MQRSREVARIVLLMLAGCTVQTASRAPTPAPAAPVFSFVPPERTTPNSAGVSFSIVNGRYTEPGQWTGTGPLRDFATYLGSGFAEALAARGYTTRGPFESYEMMTFPDRQNTDLVLQPDLQVTVSITGLRSVPHVVILGQNYYTYTGLITVGGRLNLSVLESLSKERMWVRNIDIPRKEIPFQGTMRFPAGTSQAADESRFPEDPGFTTPLAAELVKVYQQILQTSWTYLDPREMTVVKNQSQDVRKRWVTTTRPN